MTRSSPRLSSVSRDRTVKAQMFLISGCARLGSLPTRRLRSPPGYGLGVEGSDPTARELETRRPLSTISHRRRLVTAGAPPRLTAGTDGTALTS